MAVLVPDSSQSTLLFLLLALPFCYIVVGSLVNHRKLKQFRGPPLAGYSRAWMFWQSINARVNRAEFDAIRKYGTLQTRRAGNNSELFRLGCAVLC
jgi:hypothetical protein